MNNKTQTKVNFLTTISKFVKDNIKILILTFAAIFLIFLTYQGYSYYNINKINKLSISFFENIKINDELTKYEEMNKISNQKGFYSILSKLEIIKNNIKNGEFDDSLKLYNEILNSSGLDNNYVSLVAINGAYNFINIVIKNKNVKYIDSINNFISLIDDNLDNYIGNKNELLYLMSILSLNSDSSYKNNKELLTFYDNMMNNEKISSTIKERVKKIHEFYIFI